MNTDQFYRRIGHILNRHTNYRELNNFPGLRVLNLSQEDFPLVAINRKDSKYFVPNGANIYDISYVLYIEGMITWHQSFPTANYYISFLFNGCAMAKLRINGYDYIYHIALHDNQKDCRRIWNDFIKANKGIIDDGVLFLPYTASEPIIDDMIKNKEFTISNLYSTCGLITRNNECYSIIIKHSDFTAISSFRCHKRIYINGGNETDLLI